MRSIIRKNNSKITEDSLAKVVYPNKFNNLAFWSQLAWSLVRAVLVFGLCFIIVYPLLVKFSASLMSENDLFNLTVKWIPKQLDFQSVARNYRDVYFELRYGKALLNSASLALLVSVLQLASCTVIGYGFARFKFFGSRVLFAFVIITLLIPPQMVMIPLFMNFRFFNIFGLFKTPVNFIGTLWPFVLTSLTGMGLKNGLFIYIMREYFKGTPTSLEEAALVDGAGHLRTFFRIMLPSATPAMLIVFLFSFVWQYNDFFLTSMYMRSSQTLLPFMLERLALSFDTYEYSTEYMSVINNTGMIMFIAPLLVLYAFLQRFFIESIERTGIVG